MTTLVGANALRSDAAAVRIHGFGTMAASPTLLLLAPCALAPYFVMRLTFEELRAEVGV